MKRNRIYDPEMSNKVFISQVENQTITPIQHISRKPPIQVWVATVLVVLLLVAPRSRVVFGAPIYFIDVLALLIIVMPMKGQMYRWVPSISISKVVPVYFGTILVSEMRGMIEYGTIIESVYMMARYMIAISLFLTIPRLVSHPEHIKLILKGMLVGTIISAVIVILYSMGPTRSLVVNSLFANSYLNPGWQRFLEKLAIYGAGEVALRGRSLVGAATMTAGFLGVAWPIAFISYAKFKQEVFWGRLAVAAIVLAPIAILMTYGRGAWIIVGVVIFLVAVFGLASGRKILLSVMVAGSIAANQLDIDSDLFYFSRIYDSLKTSIDNPFADASTSERVLSFVEPFDHLIANPLWLVAGAGQTGNKMKNRGKLGNQLYDELGLATHSAFAKAYYNFGVAAAICQILFIALSFRFIFFRALRMRVSNKNQQLIWQSLLVSWCTYSLWWASGHAMVGEPRGVMLSFLLFGLILTFEKLRLFEAASKRERELGADHKCHLP